MRKAIFVVLGLGLALLLGTGESAAQKKKKANGPIQGKVFAVDEEKGFIRLLVQTRNKKETSTTDPLYKIDDDTKIIINTGKDKKEYMGKEGLKEVKKDDQATVVIDSDFKTISVTINPGKR
jgi:hypothetical protein